MFLRFDYSITFVRSCSATGRTLFTGNFAISETCFGQSVGSVSPNKLDKTVFKQLFWTSVSLCKGPSRERHCKLDQAINPVACAITPCYKGPEIVNINQISLIDRIAVFWLRQKHCYMDCYTNLSGVDTIVGSNQVKRNKTKHNCKL